MGNLGAVALATSVFFSAAGAMAETHEVQMLNNGAAGAMVFEPAFLTIQPGDTVHFVPANPGHNAESIKDLIPAGATPFKGRVSQDFEVKFDVEGAYAYKCAPHFGMGMVGLIVVGKSPSNLDAIRNAPVPPRAKALLDKWIASLPK